jgi:hypothetical protein
MKQKDCSEFQLSEDNYKSLFVIEQFLTSKTGLGYFEIFKNEKINNKDNIALLKLEF